MFNEILHIYQELFQPNLLPINLVIYQRYDICDKINPNILYAWDIMNWVPKLIPIICKHIRHDLGAQDNTHRT